MHCSLTITVFLTILSWIHLPVNAQSPCIVNNNLLNCTILNSDITLNTENFHTNNLAETRIFYGGNVRLRIRAPNTNVIIIRPIDPNDRSRLTISGIETSASRIDVHVTLSSAQIPVPLFAVSSIINTTNASLSIMIRQVDSDIDAFRVFESPLTLPSIIGNYRVIFEERSGTSPSIRLRNFLNGLPKVSGIMISGINHTLTVENPVVTPFPAVNSLSLKGLVLRDPVLNQFDNVSSLTIEECTYNSSSQFLNASKPMELSLTMKNNNLLDSKLPNGNHAFRNTPIFYNSITLIEPKLNSSCLEAISWAQRPRSLTLELGDYNTRDFENYGIWGPTIWFLTVRNIRTLDIFPSKFFSNFDAIQSVVLQGTFSLRKHDLCPFVGMPLPANFGERRVTLNSSRANENSWDSCAQTYVTAINQRSTSLIVCPGSNGQADCRRWAEQTVACGLVAYESTTCPGNVPTRTVGPRFYYNGSMLQMFFQQTWGVQETTPDPNGTSSKGKETIDFRPVIGALVGLLVAITVLTVTVFCIRRRRQKESPMYAPSAPEEKYVAPSSYDPTHVSIATSKTSKSSTRALEKSFFPVQPTDEIAPPLYTAPSEAVASVSPYQNASAPAERRDSVRTQATHVYETVDS